MRHTEIEILRKCQLFEGIDEQTIKTLFVGNNYKVVRWYKHDLYCLDGDICTHADIILHGEMAARMTGMSGRQVEVIRLRQSDIIAPCFLYSSNQRLPVEIEAIEETLLMRMSIATFDNLINTQPTIRHNFIRIISDIASYLASKIGFLSLMTIREKVIYFLQSEARTQHSMRLRLDMSRQRIADSFAIQKFSLLRCLANLAEHGIIRIEGKEIEILDMKRLK